MASTPKKTTISEEGLKKRRLAKRSLAFQAIVLLGAVIAIGLIFFCPPVAAAIGLGAIALSVSSSTAMTTVAIVVTATAGTAAGIVTTEAGFKIADKVGPIGRIRSWINSWFSNSSGEKISKLESLVFNNDTPHKHDEDEDNGSYLRDEELNLFSYRKPASSTAKITVATTDSAYASKTTSTSSSLSPTPTRTSSSASVAETDQNTSPWKSLITFFSQCLGKKNDSNAATYTASLSKR